MGTENKSYLFTKELLELLDETFEHTQGIYLDKGNSLFDTIEKVSAGDASKPGSAGGTTIAGQIEHVRYYLRLLASDLLKSDFGKVDWQDSWRMTEVTNKEWEALKGELRKTYQSVESAIKKVEKWEGEDDFGASLAILAHTAYHLGAIRQMLSR